MRYRKVVAYLRSNSFERAGWCLLSNGPQSRLQQDQALRGISSLGSTHRSFNLVGLKKFYSRIPFQAWIWPVIVHSLVVYLMSRSPQSTQYLLLSIRALACDCLLHCLPGILSLTTLPQLGQKRTGGFVSRWLKLGHDLMFILIIVRSVSLFKHKSR